MPNPSPAPVGDGAEERQNPAFGGSQLGEPSPVGPQSPARLPGTLPEALRHAGGARWLLFLLACRSHSARRQHRGSCGMRERSPAEPILISLPLPRLAGATAHPVPFQGDSRGKQRTPHSCDCIGEEEKNHNQQISFAKSFLLERKKKLFRNQ